MRPILLAAFIALGGGCYYHDPQVSVGYSAGYGYAYAAPSMTYIAPGVQVVMDYDYPVFYSDGYYWRYNGGLWYRSGYYNRGWNVWYDVPYSVRGISRPERYVRYRGGNYRGNTYRGNTYRGNAYRPNQNWGRRNTAPNPSSRTYRSAPTQSSAPPSRGNGGNTFRSARPIVRDHR